MKYPIQLIKLFLPVILIISISFHQANAQEIKIGITAGVNASSHLNNFLYEEGDINLDFNPSPSIGYNGGLMVRANLSEKWRVQLEPSAAMLGANYDDSFELRGFNFQSDSKTKLLYLHLPLLVQLSTTPPERTVYGRQRAETTYHLTGGVYGGYLLDATFSGTNTGAPIGIQFQGDFSEDVLDQYKEYDGGLILGGGLEHGVESKIGMELRAFFSVIDSGNRDTLELFKPQNMGVTFAVYYLL